MRAVICMSSLVPQNKLEAIQNLGAEIRIEGHSQDEAQVEADRLAAEEGMVMLPPFDHPDVIAGQGTVGLEILEDLPEVDSVLVPLSGGGLIAGIAKVMKSAPRPIRVIGITMEQGAAMFEASAPESRSRWRKRPRSPMLWAAASAWTTATPSTWSGITWMTCCW